LYNNAHIKHAYIRQFYKTVVAHLRKSNGNIPISNVLPRKPIENKYDGIPKQIEIKHAEWEKYWEGWNMELNDVPEPDFEDAISTKWWKEIQINISDIRNNIDKIITRAEWNGGTSWKTEKAKLTTI